jgi:hypothetical protein
MIDAATTGRSAGVPFGAQDRSPGAVLHQTAQPPGDRAGRLAIVNTVTIDPWWRAIRIGMLNADGSSIGEPIDRAAEA